MIVKPLAAEEPTMAGRYRLLGELGSGGMGRVLLGVGPDGRFVAVKQVHQHLLEDWEYRARFQREVSASTRVSGVFTAPVIDFDVHGHPPWLASVFITGVPLDSAVDEFGPLPPAELRTLAIGLVSALREIHRCGLIHRDLKPANVLLAADGPRVIDFGIAAMAERPSSLTQTGSLLGSPAFMSPEQALSESITPASDVFALGSLLVKAATGTNPFAASTLAYTLFNIIHTEPDLSAVPSDLRDLMAACLHKDPAQRPTPDQLLARLGEQPHRRRPWSDAIHAVIDLQATHLAALTADPHATQAIPGARRASARRSPAAPPTAGPSPAPGRKRRKRVLGGVAAGVVALLAAGFAWFQLTSGTTEFVPEPTAAELGGLDACPWVHTALGERLPESFGQPTEVSGWNFKTTESWGCFLKIGDRRLSVQPGRALGTMATTGAKVAGLPLLQYQGTGDGDCDQGVDLSGADRGWGLVVTGNIGCEFTNYVLDRLLSTRSAAQPVEKASLAHLVPCDLIDRAAVDTLVGPMPGTPSSADAHSCTWQGSKEVSVKFERYSTTYLAGFSVKTLPDGTAVHADAPASSGRSCRLIYSYRTLAEHTEMAEVQISGADNQREQHCATAESLLKSVIAALPQPN